MRILDDSVTHDLETPEVIESVYEALCAKFLKRGSPGRAGTRDPGPIHLTVIFFDATRGGRT